MSPIIKNVLLALGLAVIVAVGYAAFFRGDDEESLTSTSATTGGGEVPPEARELLAHLRELQRIDYHDDILSDPRFTSLVNFRQQLVDEPTGRPNPFVPVR